jgi:hypothetical protein
MSYLNLFIAALIAIVFSLNANAATSINTNTLSVIPPVVKQVLGGPRTVIQAMADVIVGQPAATLLQITIVDSEDNSVIEMETEAVSTVISVKELGQGTYTVETIDESGDYQEFSIVIL